MADNNELEVELKIGLSDEDKQQMADEIYDKVNDETQKELDEMHETIQSFGQLRPAGTDTSTNILNFKEDKGMYVATDNGYWYYWNGSAYVYGGVFQAPEIPDGSITYSKLSDDTKNKIDLKLENLDNGYASLKGTFARGTLYNGIYNSNCTYRVASVNKITYERDITISIESGYCFGVMEFDSNDNIILDSGWKYGSKGDTLLIPANTPFTIQWRKDPQDTSIVCDVEEYLTYIKVTTNIQTQINELNSKLNKNSQIVNDYLASKKYLSVGAKIGFESYLNSYESLITTAYSGFYGAEIDLRITSDGQIICIHSEDITNIVENCTGVVSNYTLNELLTQTYKEDGTHLISFNKALEVAKKYNLKLHLDVKSDGYEETHQNEFIDKIISSASLYGMLNSIVFVTQLTTTAQYIRGLLPNAVISLKGYNKSLSTYISLANSIGGNILIQEESATFTEEEKKTFRKNGLPIYKEDFDYTQSLQVMYSLVKSEKITITGVLYKVDNVWQDDQNSLNATIEEVNNDVTIAFNDLPIKVIKTCKPLVFARDSNGNTLNMYFSDSEGKYIIKNVNDYSLYLKLLF